MVSNYKTSAERLRKDKMTFRSKKNQKSFVHYFYKIPNTQNGKYFITLLRQFLNKDRYKIRVKGRGTRKYHGNGQNLPLKYAEHFAVYIDTKTFDQNNPAYYYQKDYQVRCKLRELRDEINRLLK